MYPESLVPHPDFPMQLPWEHTCTFSRGAEVLTCRVREGRQAVSGGGHREQLRPQVRLIHRLGVAARGSLTWASEIRSYRLQRGGQESIQRRTHIFSFAAKFKEDTANAGSGSRVDTGWPCLHDGDSMRQRWLWLCGTVCP